MAAVEHGDLPCPQCDWYYCSCGECHSCGKVYAEVGEWTNLEYNVIVDSEGRVRRFTEPSHDVRRTAVQQAEEINAVRRNDCCGTWYQHKRGCENA